MMSKLIRLLALTMHSILLSVCINAQPTDIEKTSLLHALDSTQDVAVTWGKECTDCRIELNTDIKFISEGKGSLRLVAHSGKKPGVNYYAGIMLPLKDVDVEDRALILDCWTSTPASTQALYVRLYSTDKQTTASWCNWSRPFEKSPALQVRLNQGVTRSGFTWEEKNIRAQNTKAIAAAEIIIGTSIPDATFDIYLDNLRMTETRYPPFAKITAPKKLYLETPLMREGRAEAIIIAPNQPDFLILAQVLQNKIKEIAGTELPIVMAGNVPSAHLSSTTAILLGNVCNNKAMQQLYAWLYTPVDDFFPRDENGYLVHTVHDPWGTGKNAVIIGAASLAGAARGVDAFLKIIKHGKDIILPKLILADLGEKEMQMIAQRNKELTETEIKKQVDLARRAFDTGAHRSVAGRMGSYGLQYLLSSNDLLAKLYKEIALAWYASYQAKPNIYGGPWGMDMDFHLMEILPSWDLLEESPALTDEDRMKVTKILYEFIITDVVRKAAGALRSPHVRHNHMTFPALGLYFAGRYFKNGYNNIEADYWLDIARACFTLQAQAWKPYEDCNGYGWLVPYHTMRYALATLDPTYFTNGNVRRQADYAILTMDNLGYQVPYGDTGSYQCWWTEIPFLRGALYYLRDGRYAWALEKKLAVRKDASMFQYACRVTPQEPTDLLGARAIPLDRMYWETFNGPASIPLEKAVDKVVMRASFHPHRQYLLLDGLSNGGHMHYDGNSISRITDRGRIWLADNDYIKSLPKFHNSILVFKNGQADPLPPYCELEAVADGAQFGASQTAVLDYTGVDWYRTIIWSKDKFFLVIDDLEAQEPANYDFHCMWHAVGEAKITPEGIEVEQKGPRFFIKNIPGPRLKLTHDYELGKNWVGYEFARPVVHSLRQVQSASLAQGDRVCFANLLYCTDDTAPQDFSIASAGKGCVVINAKDQRLIAGTSDPRKEREPVPGLRIAAQVFAVSENSAFVVNLRSLAWGNFDFTADQPVTFELADGRITVTSTSPVNIATTFGQTRTMTLEVGKHQIEMKGAITFPGLNDVLAGITTQLAPAQPPAAEAKYLEAKHLWSFRPAIEEVLLTGNAGRTESYATGASVTCAPSPLPVNIFARPDTPKGNLIENLLDGDETSVQGSTMWAQDTPVTVTVDLKARYRLSRIVLSAWYGSKSTKGKAFMLDRVIFEISDDNFQNDLRLAGEIADKETRQDWGKPVHYTVADLKTAARYVRARLLPRKNSGIYLAEIEIWGHPEGKELDPTKLLSGEDALEKFTALGAGDLDGDGIDEVFAGSNKHNVWCLSAVGRPRWKFSTAGKLTTVTCANLDKTKERFLIAGSEDCRVYALTPAGALRWSFELPPYKGLGKVRVLFAADINADGYEEVIAGGDNWRYFALDRHGQKLWHYESVHPSSAGAAADLDGDGKMETLCGTVYYWWHCAGFDGTRRWSYSVRAPHATVALAANLHGGKQRCAIFGAKDGTLHVLDHNGKLRWTFNVGDEVTGALALDLNGDGREEIVASSQSYNVFALDAHGKPIWRRNLGDSVLCLTAVDINGDGKNEIVAGCEDGTIFALNPSGEIIGRFTTTSAVTALVPAHLFPGPKQQPVARTLNGYVTVIEW